MEEKWRIVEKDGTFRIKHTQAPINFCTRTRNFFNWLVDSKWRWTLLAGLLPFPFSWIIFASFYYSVSWHNGDFDQITANGTDHQACIQNTINFVSMFLFSVETQTTIGYGYRYTTEQCPLTIILVSLQYLTGALLEAFLVSLIWVRLIRPKSRSRQILFSKSAVINRDESGRPCFRIRLFDTSSKYLVQTWIRLYFAKKWFLNNHQSTFTFELRWMDLGQLYGKEKLLLMWPVEVVHVIHQNSPLFPYISAGNLNSDDFEIIAVVEGLVEATGLVTQTRTSYTPDEIQWEHKFVPISYTRKRKTMKLISTELDSTVPQAHPTQLESTVLKGPHGIYIHSTVST